MALTEKHMEAKQRYISISITCAALAKELQVDPKTVCRWKAEDAQKGEAQSWDYQLQVHSMSFGELRAIFREAITMGIAKLKSNPEELFNAKTADTLSKMMKSLENIDPQTQYFSAIIDLIRVANTWLLDHQPELQAMIAPYWECIRQALSDHATRKGLL
jgi:hypothetical protein